MAPQKKSSSFSLRKHYYTDYNEQPWVTSHLKGNDPVTTSTLHHQSQTSSNDDSDDNRAADAITPGHYLAPDPFNGHSNITRPSQAKRLHTLSELIDPEAMPENSHIRTQSGNLLSKSQYAEKVDRPASMRERQAAIKARVREQSRMAVLRRGEEEAGGRLPVQRALARMGVMGRRFAFPNKEDENGEGEEIGSDGDNGGGARSDEMAVGNYVTCEGMAMQKKSKRGWLEAPIEEVGTDYPDLLRDDDFRCCGCKCQ